jgi:hypothetical protein
VCTALLSLVQTGQRKVHGCNVFLQIRDFYLGGYFNISSCIKNQNLLELGSLQVVYYAELLIIPIFFAIQYNFKSIEIMRQIAHSQIYHLSFEFISFDYISNIRRLLRERRDQHF